MYKSNRGGGSPWPGKRVKILCDQYENGKLIASSGDHGTVVYKPYARKTSDPLQELKDHLTYSTIRLDSGIEIRVRNKVLAIENE